LRRIIWAFITLRRYCL